MKKAYEIILLSEISWIINFLSHNLSLSPSLLLLVVGDPACVRGMLATMTRRRRRLKHEGICQSLLIWICCSCLGEKLMSSLFLYSSRSFFFCVDPWYCSCSIIVALLHSPVDNSTPQFFLFFFHPEYFFLPLKNITATIFQSLIFIWLGPFSFLLTPRTFSQ